MRLKVLIQSQTFQQSLAHHQKVLSNLVLNLQKKQKMKTIVAQTLQNSQKVGVNLQCFKFYFISGTSLELLSTSWGFLVGLPVSFLGLEISV